MNRLTQVILIVSTLAVTWLGMQVVHEAGHVIGAWTSGGSVSRVSLHPLRFSETVLSHNPHPLWVVWAGPLFGVLIPVLVWGVAARLKASFAYLLRFFAGFCLLANGAYLGVGVFDDIADAGMLVSLGVPAWQLWLFGLVCMPASFVLWHRLGPSFGLGEAGGKADRRHAFAVLTLFAGLVFTEVALMLA